MNTEFGGIRMKTQCSVCFRHCSPAEGETGFCRARTMKNGKMVCTNYGELTAAGLDPVEKKPLHRFYPGSMILSVGSYGCNLRCPFCQNNEISMISPREARTRFVPPEELAGLALKLRDQNNIGVAFTYNEALIGFEYVRDTARLVHENGMKNVVVTNGTASLEVLEELKPHIDAMNIDLKSFNAGYYRDVLGGDLAAVKSFIAEAVRFCHVEITTLIVPGENDSEEEMRAITSWIASLKNGKGSDIPLHITRFFPNYRMTDRPATEIGKIRRLVGIAREKLDYVFPGNC